MQHVKIGRLRFAVPSTVFLKETKEKTSVLTQQKSRRQSTIGACIEELKYTSSSLEWILNS